MRKNSVESHQFEIDNQLAEISRIAVMLDAFAAYWRWTEKFKHEVNLAVEEVVSNIIMYAYTDALEHRIKLNFEQDEARLRITIKDDGKHYDWLQNNKKVDVNAPVEEREIGGLGIHLLKNIMDEVNYRREENMNVVTLIKKI
jgi:anti-sigma regulatory factor (Ser/Thr protein kinase)